MSGVLCLFSTGLTAAAMAEALKLQKMRMMMGFHGNSDQQRHHNGERTMSPLENDDTGRKLHNRHSRFNLSDIMKLTVSPPLLMQEAAKDPGRRSSASSLLLPPRF